MVRRDSLTDMGLWDGEYGPVEVVKAVRCIPREFQMLPLVLANGDMGCPVISTLVSHILCPFHADGYPTYERGYRQLGELGKRKVPAAAVHEHLLALKWCPLVTGACSASYL